jgi:hypothetical protein
MNIEPATLHIPLQYIIHQLVGLFNKHSFTDKLKYFLEKLLLKKLLLN